VAPVAPLAMTGASRFSGPVIASRFSGHVIASRFSSHVIASRFSGEAICYPRNKPIFTTTIRAIIAVAPQIVRPWKS